MRYKKHPNIAYMRCCILKKMKTMSCPSEVQIVNLMPRHSLASEINMICKTIDIRTLPLALEPQE